ncbi:MAG TPA: PQQ-binding-like beta-propeller repeat protein [Anaeromyxobacteraceae bacterium]|nr:PQQ-binding-like beta-propeller repeat protein [Anaeromyxobacteraceae bacterium]
MMRRVTATAALALLAAGCGRPAERLFAQPIESASYSNPVVTRDMIIFGSDEGGVYGYYKDGTRRWTFNPSLRQVFSAPAWDGANLVFFGATNQNVYAVQADTGQQVWAFRTQDRVKGDPTFWQGLVIVGSYDRHLYGLDARTGHPRWVFPQPRPRPPPPKGKARVEEPEQHVVDTGEFSYSKPLVAGGVAYVGNLDGHLYAVDAATGLMRWRFRTGRGTEQGGIGITSSPAVSGGVLFFGSGDHQVYALAEGGVQVRWVFKTGDAVLASPRVADGVVYVGSADRYLYALDEKTGALKWKLQGNGPFVSSPAIHGRYLIQCGGAGDGTIRLVDRDTGAVVWSYRTERKIESDPVVVGDAFYVTGGDGRLYAFKINAR